jgi:hypothetical protein
MTVRTTKGHLLALAPAGVRSMRARASWVLALAMVTAAPALASDLPLRLTASSETTGVAAGIARDVEITITRWSTEPDRHSLVDAFLHEGPWGLLDVLQRSRNLGRIKPARGRVADLRFAARYTLPGGGLRLILLTDRPLGHWIVWTQMPVSVSDYPFMLVEVHFDRNGEGTGKLSLTTRVDYDHEARILALERYEKAPVWIQNVRVEPRE